MRSANAAARKHAHLQHGAQKERRPGEEAAQTFAERAGSRYMMHAAPVVTAGGLSGSLASEES